MPKCLNCNAELKDNKSPYDLCPDCWKLYYTRPCKGCTERKLGCHSNCETYTAWTKVHAAAKELQDAESAYKHVLFRRFTKINHT